MTIRFKAWMVAFVCCLLAAPVMAATDEDENENNAYVSINGGVTKAAHACYNAWTPSGMGCNENYSGYRLAYGYQFTPAWGIEISYGDFGYAEAKGTGMFVDAATGLPFTGQYSWSLKAIGWAAFGTATLNLGKHFALFGKLGGARPEFREQDITHNLSTGVAYYGVPTAGGASTHFAYGGGAQVNFTPSFGLRVQYEYFGKYDVYNIYGVYGQSLPKVGLSMGSLGAVFKF